MRITRRQKWIGSALLSMSAGLTALQTQDVHASLYQKLVAFFAPACAAAAAAALHDPGKETPK